MKIMTAMYTLRRGGAYDRFLMMLEAFLERDCEIHCLSLTPIQIRSPFFNNHVIRLPFHLSHHTLTRISVLILFPFYTLFVGWREKIDLFIAFNSLYAFIQAMSKWILKKPMVTLIRGDFAFGLKMQDSFKSLLWLNKAVEYLGLIASDRILTVNTDIKGKVVRVIGSRKNIDVEIFFNNILVSNHSTPMERMAIRNLYAIPEDAKVLVTAGVLNRGKNIEVLLKSLPKIGIKNLFLFIIGDGSTKEDTHHLEDLKEMTKELGLEKKVIFTGWLQKEEMWRIFRSADLFLLSSLNEGMPNVLLEALGFDLPCLGSRISGIEDILQHEELMFDPRNDAVIADKVRQFFSDDQHSKDIIQLCRERKKTFAFDWKERAFQMVTQRPFHRGEACQSR
jgi:glycosyltransferase involved in cell wall biosynthesis